MDSNKFILCKRYAKAFLNIYYHTMDFATVINIDKLINFLKSNQKDLFYIQLFDNKSKLFKDAFYKLLANFDLHQSFQKLIDLLIQNHRLFLIINLFEAIAREYRDRSNYSRFTIETAQELTEADLNKLKLFLERKTKTEVYYYTKTNPHLIAGVKMYSDDYNWEHSVLQKLKKLDSYSWK